MIVSIWRKFWGLYASKKSTLFFTFSLRYCIDIVNLLFWVFSACLATHTEKYHFIENLCVYLQKKKINFISHAFLKILQRLANLFWILWAYLVTHTQNGSIVEDFNVYLHAKNKFHYSPFSWGIIFKKTLQFDWLTAFWPINWELEFCQIWHWWWNINGNISFYYRLFLRIKK